LMTGVEQSRNTNETFRFASPHVDGSDLAHPVETILVTFEKPMNKRQGPEEEEASENNGPDSAWFSNLLFKHADYNETAPVPDLGGRPTIDISTPDAETLLSWKSGTSASLSAEQLDLLDEAQASLCFTIKSNIFAKGSLVIRQGTTPLPRDFSGAHPRML